MKKRRDLSHTKTHLEPCLVDDVALLEAGAVGALNLVHHVARDLRVERPLQHHLRLRVARVDREVVEPPILWNHIFGQPTTY